MTRAEIITRFREENPEITANVVTDATLKSWCQVGDKEICAKARLIVDSGSFVPTEDVARYDLTTKLTKFFDIDEYPGGGISVVDSDEKEKRLEQTTKAKLDDDVPRWRTEESGTPLNYFVRGKYVYLRPAPDSDIDQINVDFVAISDNFDDDAKTPFNQISKYEPFHYGIVQYLRWRAKGKVGKPEDAATAMNEYNAFIDWIIKSVGGKKYGPIYFRPSGVTPKGTR